MNESEIYLSENFEDIKKSIFDDFELSNASYNTWILPLSFNGIEDDTVHIGVPQDIGQALPYIKKYYRDFFLVKISEQLGRSVDVVFEKNSGPVKEEKDSSSSYQDRDNTSEDLSSEHRRVNLNPRYTFDSFVVGNNNRFAQAASLAVAESPGEVYNPLFLYGAAGLGKTHLMHSIGNYIIANHPGARVLYVTSETFTNEVIASIRSSNAQDMSNLRKKYRDVDVLMVDDVQFIIGKESTQEEFFHTFNELHNAGKQIVLSSDKPPKDMTTLEERFRSRFEWGLIADIQPPDYETRMAILQKNAVNYPGHIEDEVFSYIADNIKSNIRELEGAFRKIIAHSQISGEDIDLAKAEIALKDIITHEQTVISPPLIIEKTCEYYNISKEEIVSSKRSKDIALPRQVAMYFIRSMTDTSYDEIGKILGGRDHTTVMSGINKIKDQLLIDNSLKEQVDNIRIMIEPNV